MVEPRGITFECNNLFLLINILDFGTDTPKVYPQLVR